jgi:ElaB/YqjD/DUF883 family membrane-anchored ribosome-binding protein
MDYPVKKPKKEKSYLSTVKTSGDYVPMEGVKTSKHVPSLKSVTSSMIGTTGSIPKAKSLEEMGYKHEPIKTKSLEEMGYKLGSVKTSKISDDADDEIAKSYSDLADKVTKSVGSDTGSKAERIKARAMLVKAKAKKLRGQDEDSMESESTERYDSYDPDKGFYKSRKK